MSKKLLCYENEEEGFRSPAITPCQSPQGVHYPYATRSMLESSNSEKQSIDIFYGLPITNWNMEFGEGDFSDERGCGFLPVSHTPVEDGKDNSFKW